MIVLLAIVMVLLGRRCDTPSWWPALAGHRFTPLACGVATAAILWVVVGRDPDPVAVVGDEASYTLQASLFAHGRWTDAPLEPREAFRQIHVLDRPLVASKYPPGHAIVLAPGFLVGLPFLVPLLLMGAAGALVVLLGSRLLAPYGGLLAWCAWLAAPGTLEWRASWYSESTSGTLMLAGWWILLRASRSAHAQLALGAIAGGLAITRPLTAVTFTLPVAVFLLREAWRSRAAGPVLRPVIAAVPILALLPLWAAQTTGDATRTPLAAYTAAHMPWDRMGFGWDSTPAPDPLRADQAGVARYFEPVHRAHVPASLFHDLRARLGAFATTQVPGGAGAALVFLALGVFLVPWWMAAAGALQFAGYLLYAHTPGWSLYYAELGPVAALAVTAALCALLGRLTTTRRLGSATLAAAAILAVAAIVSVRGAAEDTAGRGAATRTFRTVVRTLPSGSIVFVRYAAGHDVHHALVTNPGPRRSLPVLIAYDMGPTRNHDIARSLGREAFLFDEGSGRLTPLSAADTAGGSATAPAGP